MWHLNTALELLGSLQHALLPVGYSVGLTGSVLFNGKSRKDIDIIIYPLSTARQNPEAVEQTLIKLGLVKEFNKDIVQARWRKLGSKDEKHVEVWLDKRNKLGRRIDIFMLK